MNTTNPQKQPPSPPPPPSPSPPHIVIIPSPGMGHLIPLIEFAKLLHSHHHHFSITLLLPTSSPPTTTQTTLLSTLPPPISHSYLPRVDPTLLPPNVSPTVTINLIHTHSLSSLRAAVTSLSNIVALVTDLFGTKYFDVAREIGVPSYLLYGSPPIGPHGKEKRSK